MWVFTTRADTIMGVTFCAVAPEHPLADHAAQDNPELAAFIEECKQGSVIEADMETMEKKGMPTGLFVTHPLTGEQVEVWVGNYVLMSYGDGAVMAVPAHDERDFEFAKKYDLPIKPVYRMRIVVDRARDEKLSPQDNWREIDTTEWQDWYASKEDVMLYTYNSSSEKHNFNDMQPTEAIDAVAAALAKEGLGDKQVTYRLHDWGISRQRYWGTPIPIIHCDVCGAVPVPEKDLPVVLPEDCVPDGSGNPLNQHEGFLNVDCPLCGKPSRRETDTMDTFVDSCWYYMRYCSPGSDDSMVDARNDYWMPMDQYIGGIEHAVMHLLYARFWTKVMRDLGMVQFDEPFTRLLTQGMVLNETYYREDSAGRKSWFNPEEVELETDDRGRPSAATLKSDGQPVQIGGIEKMAKSKNNGIDPQAIIDQYGADTARVFTMFASPPEQTLEWSGAGVEGAHRYLRRVWNFGLNNAARIDPAAKVDAAALSEAQKTTRRTIHRTLQQADNDYQRIQYNTIVSACMIMLNALEDAQGDDSAANAGVISEGLAIFLRTLNPIAPHVTHVLWEELGFTKEMGDILNAPWPQVDPAALEQNEIKMMVQVNGKLRGEFMIAKEADKATIEATALATEGAQKFITGTPKRVIVVPGKLVNIVV